MIRRVLLVIDMQGQPRVNILRPDGSAPEPGDRRAESLLKEKMGIWERVLANISRLIMTAYTQRDLVFFLEDAKVPQPTHAALWHALGPGPAIVIRKYLFDGSPAVLAAMDNLGIVVPEQVLVCGAITEVCVRQTVEGLRRAFGASVVQVAPGACFDTEWEER